MKLRWKKNDQYLQPVMRLLKVDDIVDTEDLGVSDATGLDWVSAGYATHVFDPEPIPEPIEDLPARATKRKKKAIEEV